jgi:hypothetical protein
MYTRMAGFGENKILHDGGGIPIVKFFRLYHTSLNIEEIYSMEICFIVLFIVWIFILTHNPERVICLKHFLAMVFLKHGI